MDCSMDLNTEIKCFYQNKNINIKIIGIRYTLNISHHVIRIHPV